MTKNNAAPALLPPDLAALVRAVYGPDATCLDIEVAPDSNAPGLQCLDACLVMEGDAPLSPTWEAAWGDPMRRGILQGYGVITPQDYAGVMEANGSGADAIKAELDEVIVFGGDRLGLALGDLIDQLALGSGTHRFVLEAAGVTSPAPRPGTPLLTLILTAESPPHDQDVTLGEWTLDAAQAADPSALVPVLTRFIEGAAQTPRGIRDWRVDRARVKGPTITFRVIGYGNHGYETVRRVTAHLRDVPVLPG